MFQALPQAWRSGGGAEAGSGARGDRGDEGQGHRARARGRRREHEAGISTYAGQ